MAAKKKAAKRTSKPTPVIVCTPTRDVWYGHTTDPDATPLVLTGARHYPDPYPYGDGRGDGYGYGSGSGYGDGDGDGHGDGHGDGYGYGDGVDVVTP